MELLLRLVLVLEFILYQISRPFIWWINRRPEPKISAAKNPILGLSAVVISEKIRKKELTSEAVVLAYIERIKEVNPQLNAVVEDRFGAAIEDARACDKKLAAGEVTAKQLEVDQPLFGVPITVKESCSLKGYSYTGGAVARAGIKATKDGTTVGWLKRAGAIPLCVTNTPELCLGYESVNKLFGTTNNPYDTRRTAGGSSGGEGSLLGASASLIGVGSDIAGSIRVPALFNGVFGHKPTSKLISVDGHFPITDGPDYDQFLVVGPLTRYAEDLALAVRVMAGPKSTTLRLDDPVDLKSLKIRYMDHVEHSLGLLPVEDDIKRVVKAGAEYLGSIGADVAKVNIKRLNNCMDMNVASMFSIAELPPLLLNPEDPKHESNPFAELGKLLFGLSRHTLSPIFMKIMKDANGFIPRSRIPRYQMELNKLTQTFTDLLGTDGVFLFPTLTRSAPFHGQMTLQLAATMYCMIFNMLGFPATHVPMGFDSEGLPIGLQVVALPMQDRLCLAVAKELEKGFGGWKPPSARAQY